MKQTFLIFCCLMVSGIGFSQKLLLELYEKSPEPSILDKGRFKVILLNDTDAPIRIFYCHHERYGGSEMAWEKLKDGKSYVLDNLYKPMDTNSRFDERAFKVIKPGQKKHISTMELEPKEPGIYTLKYSIKQDPSTVDGRYAENSNAKYLGSQITPMDVAIAVDYEIKAMEVKPFVAKEISYEELMKEKVYTDFSEATYDPSKIFSMKLTFEDAADAQAQFEQISGLKNIRRLQITSKSAEAITLPAAIGDLPLMNLRIQGNSQHPDLLSFSEGFLAMNSLKEAVIYRMDGNSLDFLGNHVGIEKIHIGNCNWPAVPSWIGNFTALKELIIEKTKITELPAEFANITTLDKLTLNNNALTKLYHIENNTALTQLYLANNQITEVTDKFGQLTMLKYCILASNKLTFLPKGIENLTVLSNLNLADNQLTILPAEIGKLVGLKELALDMNKISQLPSSINDIPKLSKISLSKNAFSKFPKPLLNMRYIVKIDLKNNQLTTVPEDIISIKSLSRFNFEDNKIVTLPDSFFEFRLLHKIYSKGNPLDKKTLKKLQKKYGSKLKS